MKTEQEQIKAIKQIIDERVETTLGQVQGRHDNVIKTVDTVIIARDIVNAGYGDVSEYKDEIERLKEENKRAAISYTEYVLEEDTRFSVLRDNVAKLEQKNKRLCEENIEQYKKLKKQERKTVKQAQIDVLNELKKYLHTEDFDTPDERWKPESEFCAIIDELVKEIRAQ